jgi:three-Cys-motif partner protein
MFATGMKNKWSRRTYVELFSGPGMSYIASQDRFFAGSALRAMNEDFTDFVFVDIDARATTAIAERASRLRLPRPPRVLLGDCNDLADEVLAAIPANSIALAFIDPTNWQTRYTTIETLARYPHMDLLFTFHVGTMRRVAHLDLPALRAHFPPGASLGRAVDLPRERRIEVLIDEYLAGITHYGYRRDGVKWVPVRNGNGTLLYVMVLFSKHERGLEFWQKATAIDEQGQTEMFPELWSTPVESASRPKSVPRASDRLL